MDDDGWTDGIDCALSAGRRRAVSTYVRVSLGPQMLRSEHLQHSRCELVLKVSSHRLSEWAPSTHQKSQNPRIPESQNEKMEKDGFDNTSDMRFSNPQPLWA